MIPKPSDIPNLDTTLTNNDIRRIMDVLDPRYPWLPSDQVRGRAVGEVGDAEGSVPATARLQAYSNLLTPLGWKVALEYSRFTRSTTVYVRK